MVITWPPSSLIDYNGYGINSHIKITHTITLTYNPHPKASKKKYYGSYKDTSSFFPRKNPKPYKQITYTTHYTHQSLQH
jgi:hypothetical protein